jgi:hypothetical protein
MTRSIKTLVAVFAGAALFVFLPSIAAADGTGSISGKVTDSNNQPVTDGCVRAYDLGDIRVSFSWIEPDGSYKLEGLDTGKYKVEFERCDANVLWEYYDNARTSQDATYVSVTDGADTPGINAKLDIGGTISGVVTFEPGFPVPEVCVYADKPGAVGYWSGFARVSPNGPYKIKGLETGDYKLEFRGCGDSDNVARQFYPGKANYTDAIPVSVTQGSDTPGIDAHLAPGGAITGKVIPIQEPAEVCGMSVKVFDSDGNLAGSYNSPGFLYTPVDYKIDQLITGNYRLYFEQGCLAIFSMDPFWVSEYFNNQSSLAEATPVSVTEGSTTSQVSAVLGPEGTITGKVTDTEGAPLENICVEASDENGPAGIVAHTDSGGQYSLNALSGGSYKLKFSDCQDTNELIVTSEYYDDKATLEEAVPVSVSNGRVRSAVDAQLATEARPVPEEFKARIGKLGVRGPFKVKKGRLATFRVRITNFGNAEAKGVKVKGSGRGVSFKTSIGKIAPKKTRAFKVKVKPKKAGRVKITFKATSSNAGGSAVRHGITVRK